MFVILVDKFFCGKFDNMSPIWTYTFVIYTSHKSLWLLLSLKTNICHGNSNSVLPQTVYSSHDKRVHSKSLSNMLDYSCLTSSLMELMKMQTLFELEKCSDHNISILQPWTVTVICSLSNIPKPLRDSQTFFVIKSNDFAAIRCPLQSPSEEMFNIDQTPSCGDEWLGL